MSEKGRSRGWTFTINNCKKDVVKEGIELLHRDKLIRYCILADEIGEQGTEHVQGFILFNDAKSFKKVKNLFQDKAHIEPQKSGVINNMVYCMKDDDYIEIGTRPIQGQRTDMDIIYKDIKNGRPMLEIARQYPQLHAQYRRSFDAYAQMEHYHSPIKPTTIIYYNNYWKMYALRQALEENAQFLEILTIGHYQGKAFLCDCVINHQIIHYHMAKGTFERLYISDWTLPIIEMNNLQILFPNITIEPCQKDLRPTEEDIEKAKDQKKI